MRLMKCRDTNNALEDYYAKGYGETAVPSKQDPSKLKQIFAKYKDASTGKI